MAALSDDARTAPARFLADNGGCESPLRMACAGILGALPRRESACGYAALSGMALRRTDRRDAARHRLGHFGDAPADGDFLSAVHAAGGCRHSAAHRVQSRSLLRALQSLRQTGADDDNGLWLQCGRRDGMPHHCEPPRTAHRNSHECTHSVQRQISGAACCHYGLFRGDGQYLAVPRRLHHDRAHPPEHRHDICGLGAARPDCSARRTVLIHTGAAADPPPAAPQGRARSACRRSAARSSDR